MLCGGQAYFYIFVFGLLGSTTGRGPHFFYFFLIFFLIFFFLANVSDKDSVDNDLKCLEEWEKMWLLEFNLDKCKVLHMIELNKL